MQACRSTPSTARATLVEHGVSATRTRIAILDYLQHTRSHPRADDVYASLHGSIPTLSRTTVYGTLRLLCELGLARPVLTGEGEEMRFDGDLSPHAHFRCSDCGAVLDIPCDDDMVEQCRVPAGAVVRGAELVLRGLCPSCAHTAH